MDKFLILINDKAYEQGRAESKDLMIQAYREAISEVPNGSEISLLVNDKLKRSVTNPGDVNDM